MLSIISQYNWKKEKKRQKKERKGEKEKGGRIKRAVDLKLKPTVLNLISIIRNATLAKSLTITKSQSLCL